MEEISVILTSDFSKQDLFDFVRENGGYSVGETAPSRATIEVEDGGLFLDYFDDVANHLEKAELESITNQLGRNDLVEVMLVFRYSNSSYRLAFSLADEIVKRWGGVLDTDNLPRDPEDLDGTEATKL